MKVLVKRKRRRIASGDATRERACAVPGHSIRTIRCPAPGISCTRQRQLISISYRFKPPCTMCMSGVCALGICSMFELPRRNLRPPLRADCLYLLRTYLLHSWPTRYATLDAQRSALKAPFQCALSLSCPLCPVPCPVPSPSCPASAPPCIPNVRRPALCVSRRMRCARSDTEVERSTCCDTLRSSTPRTDSLARRGTAQKGTRRRQPSSSCHRTMGRRPSTRRWWRVWAAMRRPAPS